MYGPPPFKSLLRLVWVFLAAGYAGVLFASESATPLPPPIRFLLTFDDGPSVAVENNPTAKVADTLAANPTQSGIKAVFFIQTRSPTAGGSPVGQRLLQRLAADGHILGLHSGSVRGHVPHTKMDAAELATSLNDGIADIRATSGESSDLVRPPEWAFNAMTLAVYDHTGMAMLLTDLRARDGAGWFFQVDPKTGGKLRDDFAHFRQRWAAGHIATVDGVTPVVVTFHDVNPYTAEHLTTYLATLVQAAHQAGFNVADPPFYADHAALLRAARARADNQATRAALAP